MPKRRDRPTIGSTRCTTRCIEPTSCGTPIAAAVSTAERRGGRPDVRGHRGVRRMKWLDELAEELQNEDVSSAAGAAGVHPQAGWTSSGRWGSRRSGTAWCRWRRCWSWSRSSRPTCSRSNTPTARNAVRWTPSGRSTAAAIGAYGGGRRGFDRLLRQHPARRVDEIGGPAHQRSAHVAADQDVAGSAGGRDRRAGSQASNDPEQGRGTGQPQGAPISPLLGNLYMRRFILGWKVLGHERRFHAHIVNYADDFVICCRGTADEAMAAMRSMMSEAEADGERGEDADLPGAGRDVRLPGLHDRSVLLARRRVAPTSGQRPSKKKIQAVCRRISELTDRR